MTQARYGEVSWDLTLDAVVRMALTLFRANDHVDLYDLIEVGLVNETWCERPPPELAVRLRELLANPEG